MARQSIATIRKKEILETFYEVAKDEGMENASFAKIAQRLEIQPSLIVHYYRNRDELILALIDHNLEQYKKIFSIPSTAHQSNKAHLSAVLDKMFSLEWNELFDDGVYYSCYTLIFRHEFVKEKFKALHMELRHLLEKLIRDGIEEGSFQVQNPTVVASHISNLMDGTYYFVSMLDRSSEQKQYMEESKALAKSLIGLNS